MAKAYSLDLRNRVLSEVLSGKKHEEIAKTFKIGVATLRRWAKLYKETGDLKAKKPLKTRPRKVDYQNAIEIINQNSSKTLKELGHILGTKNMSYVMKKLDFTYKKTVFIRGKKRSPAK